jgi:thioredoxin reductase (NADPH)
MIRRQGMHELIVIGGGVAGLAAAAFVARFGHHVALMEASGAYGGLIASIGQVDGVLPAYRGSGQAYASDLTQDCVAAGVEMLNGEAIGITGGDAFRVATPDGKHYRARAVVVASGGVLRKLGVPGEKELTGRGVSQCATCDGGFFRSAKVCVIGGGNAAAQEALILADICQTVTIVSRSKMRASDSYVRQLSARPNVTFIWNAAVEAIIGESRVEAVRLRDTRSGALQQHACAGLFPFIGVEPNAAFVDASLKDAAGRVQTSAALETAMPGLFAIGAARRGYGGQINQALADGITAGQGVVMRLRGEQSLPDVPNVENLRAKRRRV